MALAVNSLYIFWVKMGRPIAAHAVVYYPLLSVGSLVLLGHI
jgi:hypothetical protein